MRVSYAVIREDLPHGVQLAQVGHAVQEALGHLPTVMVVLAVADEAALRRVVGEIALADLAHAAVVEDAGPFAGQLVAVGLRPTLDRKTIKEVLGGLPLAGKK